jgi:hypothetical protein
VAFVNAMIPLPGETPGAWWENVGWEEAQRGRARLSGRVDLDIHFLHDIPADIKTVMCQNSTAVNRPFSDAARSTTGRSRSMPSPAATTAFSAELQQRIARERLGIETDVVPGGHLVALNHPLSCQPAGVVSRNAERS